MKMKNSHNSYWMTGDPVKISVNYGCDIIEADIINRHLDLGHSWRPFRSMYYGNLIDRYLKNFPKDKILYIEFKTGDSRVRKPLFEALLKSGIEKIIVNAQDHFFIERVHNYNAFMDEYKNKLPLTTLSQFEKLVHIENVDLYDKSLLHF